MDMMYRPHTCDLWSAYTQTKFTVVEQVVTFCNSSTLKILLIKLSFVSKQYFDRLWPTVFYGWQAGTPLVAYCIKNPDLCKPVLNSIAEIANLKSFALEIIV